MSSGELGCTRNPDGSLKDATDIQWSFSQESSPALEPDTPKQKEPVTGKAPKVTFNHTMCAITNAVNLKAAQEHHQLTNEDRLKILFGMSSVQSTLNIHKMNVLSTSDPSF
jgi:hypothetical protein